MKYHFFTLGLVAILFTACAVNEEDHSTPAIETEEEFYATIEGATTKVFVDDQLRVLWNADDRVSIFNKYTYNQEYRFTGEDGENSGSFKKVPNDDFVTGNTLDLVYSVYPYRESTRITNDGEISVILPAEQTYREDSFGLGDNTMVSVTENNELLFKNLCGYMLLKLYGDDVNVSSITLKGNNDERLAGRATVTMPVDGLPSLEMAENAGTEITLVCESPVRIGASAESATAFWLVVPPTMFENGFTLTVKDDRNGKFVKKTSKPFEIKRNKLERMAELEVVIKRMPVPEAVDLGLSVMWASFNLGASKPEEFGDYYAWGETQTKNYYSWDTYKFGNGDSGTLSKYNRHDSYGTVDNLMVLESVDDAAQVKLGNGWRMPTDSECIELQEKCTWTWTTENGVTGYRVAAPNGNSIFLPAAGYRYQDGLGNVGTDGYYWSSTLSWTNSKYAIITIFFPDQVNRGFGSRYDGHVVRPVLDIPKQPYNLYFPDNTRVAAVDGSLKWSARDHIMVTNCYSVIEGFYVDESNDGSSSVQYSTSANFDGMVCCAYPYESVEIMTDDHVGWLSIPVTQTGNLEDCFFLYGESTGTDVPMEMQNAILKIKVQAPNRISSVIIQSDNNLCGLLKTFGGGSLSEEPSYIDMISVPNVPDSDSFYVALFPGTYSYITFLFTDSEGNTASKRGNLTLNKATTTVLNFSNLEWQPPV